MTRAEAVAAVREALDTSETREEAQRRVLDILNSVEVEPHLITADLVYDETALDSVARMLVKIRERFQT